MDMINKELLIERALEARQDSYSPYSNFSVGAALLCKDGTIVTGANIENASYGATICAERTAIYKAVLDGKKEFVAIAISGGKHDENPSIYAYPCGICRQVMSEFCDRNFHILVAKSVEDFKEYTLEDLLPESFEL